MRHDTRVQNPCAKIAWKIPPEYDELKQDNVEQHLASPYTALLAKRPKPEEVP